MDKNAYAVSLLAVLIAVVLALAAAVGPAVAGGTTAHGGARATARHLMAPVVEDDVVAPEQLAAESVGVHRRVLATLKNSVFEPNKPACISTCGARGTPYTRGCRRAFQCVG